MHDKIKTRQLIELIDKADYYKSVKDFKSAILCYEEFIKIEPSKPAVYSILANLYEKEYGDNALEKQLYYYSKLLELNPLSRLGLHGLAFGFEKLGDNIEADKYYKKLLENSPTDIDYYNYGMFLIHTGDFINGHKYFTKRFNISDNPILQYPLSTSKKWDLSSDIADKVLLVHYEQGFGDTVMYSRFIPQLKKICKKLIFLVQSELYDLLKNSSKICEGIEIITDIENIDYDYSMGLLDAPYVLKTTIKTLPFCSGYLSASSNNYGDGFKIGISYSGDKFANYEQRNLKLDNFEILKNVEGIKLYSLQKEETENRDWILPLGKNFKTFFDTASAIMGMDLVISTDNVILNLSGALGVKTIGLFNKYTNYRWYKTQGENVGWYDFVYPLQCETENKWDNVLLKMLKKVKSELTSVE